MTSNNQPKRNEQRADKTERALPPPQGKVVKLHAPRSAPQDFAGQPLYVQIKDLLRGRILDGSYQPHQQLPSEAEMIAAFKVSRITVRQALGDLENEGLIFRLHGKGTFVSKPKAF